MSDLECIDFSNSCEHIGKHHHFFPAGKSFTFPQHPERGLQRFLRFGAEGNTEGFDPTVEHHRSPNLKEQLDPKHPIYQLNDRIDWSAINEDFKELYSHTGRPAKSVRLMVSLLLLKQLDDLSDEQVIQRWVEKTPTGSFCVERLNFSGNLQQPPQT